MSSEETPRWFRPRRPEDAQLDGVRIVCPLVPEKKPKPSAALGWGLLAVVLGQIAVLAVMVGESRYQLNGDAVAYLRIAMYYASGRTDLAVSGYWGPMISWIAAALLWIVDEPLLAMRLAMAVSAVVFLLGSISLFRRLELTPGAVLVGAVAIALMGARHASGEITPDLLVSGLICFGAAQLLSRTWRSRRRTQCAAGALFGIAYMAKAVALPVFFASALLTTALWIACRKDDRRGTLGALAVSVAMFAAVAGPWVTILSLEYGKPLFSTTARVAHAWVGPQDEYRYHSLNRIFLAPEAGRITTWEDPTRNLPYNYWSPLESASYFRHQVGVVGRNARLIPGMISKMDAFRIGMILLVLGALVHWPWTTGFRRDRWRWASVVVASGIAVYLPIFAGCPRYFFGLVPFVLTVALGLMIRLTSGEDAAGRNMGRVIGLSIVGLSFMAPSLGVITGRMKRPRPQPDWLVVADALRRESLDGPIAGGPLTAMQTALLVDEPFLGGITGATTDKYRTSGARLFVVNRDGPAAARLADAPDFESLDDRLFGETACELSVFRLVDQRSASAE